MTTEERFHAAVEVIRGLPKNGSFQPSHALQLKFYSYYKQAVEGPCKVPKPSFWDLVGKAKWDAWKTLGDMPKEEAMEKYVEELVKVVKQLSLNCSEDQIVEAMSYTENVAKFVDLLGPLFEGVPVPKTVSLPELNGNRDSEDDIETLEAPTDMTESICVKPVVNKKAEDRNRNIRKSENVINGHQSTYDSEEDEFSDTYDHLAEDENGSPADRASPAGVRALDTNETLLNTEVSEALMNARQQGMDRVLVQDTENQLWAFYSEKKPNGDILPQMRGGGDEGVAPSRSGNPGLSAGRHGRGYYSRDGGYVSQGLPSQGQGRYSSGNKGSGAGGAGAGGGQRRIPMDVSEQLALAVIRLQHTMDEVVARLETLEALLQQSRAPQINRWWIFGNVAPHMVVVIVLWPFLAQFLIHLIRRRYLRYRK